MICAHVPRLAKGPMSHCDTVICVPLVSLRYATSFFAMNVRVAPGSGTSLISQPS